MKYMGQVMAECDCSHPECEARGYCMADRRQDMSEAPERIWADGNAEWDSGSWGRDKEYDEDVEYTRTDLVRAQIEELEAKLATLEDAARSALEYVEHKESEWGVNLAMGNKLRAALASLQGDKT